MVCQFCVGGRRCVCSLSVRDDANLATPPEPRPVGSNPALGMGFQVEPPLQPGETYGRNPVETALDRPRNVLIRDLLLAADDVEAACTEDPELSQRLIRLLREAARRVLL